MKSMSMLARLVPNRLPDAIADRGLHSISDASHYCLEVMT
jgi:hypothetical protein